MVKPTEPSHRYQPLSADELRSALARLKGWSGDERGIEKTLTFSDFRGAMAFMQACVEGIEARDHHPVWTNKYNSIQIHLDTFDIGHKVTRHDIDVAEFMDALLDARGAEFGYKPS